MKKLLFLMFFLVLVSQKSYAYEYTIDEVADILIPYKDEHIMTRYECMIAINRIIGINDPITVGYLYDNYSDYFPKRDIDYNSFRGRYTDLGIGLYDRIVFSRDKDFFEGSDSATKKDILLWMGSLTNNNIYNFKADDGLIDWGVDAELIKDKESERIGDNITVAEFKYMIKNFLNIKALHYYDYIQTYSQRNRPIYNSQYNSDRPELTYLQVFNNSYFDKNIYITDKDITLGEHEIKYYDTQPFIDANSNTMLMPVRWFAELFGFKEVEWKEETGEVILSGYQNLSGRYGSEKIKMKFTNNLSEYEFVDSCIKPYDFETPSQIIDGCMYVPLRAVCESLMYNVIWDAD